jgi:hypothetical protein
MKTSVPMFSDAQLKFLYTKIMLLSNLLYPRCKRWSRAALARNLGQATWTRPKSLVPVEATEGCTPIGRTERCLATVY